MPDPKPTDADLMKGHPADNLDPATGKPREPAAAAPELVEVELAGKKVKVTQDVADALTAQAEEHDRMLADARAAARPAPAPKPADGKTPLEQFYEGVEAAVFTDPTGTFKRFEQIMRAEITGDLTKRYETEQFRRDFWSTFNEDNPDLKGATEQMVVRAVFNEKYPALTRANKTVAESQKEIARDAKALILKLKGDQGGKGGKPAAEGGNEPGNLSKNRQSKQDDGEGPMSLTQVLRQRREARAAAARGQKPMAH